VECMDPVGVPVLYEGGHKHGPPHSEGEPGRVSDNALKVHARCLRND
jgi:hypothetical protein